MSSVSLSAGLLLDKRHEAGVHKVKLIAPIQPAPKLRPINCPGDCAAVFVKNRGIGERSAGDGIPADRALRPKLKTVGKAGKNERCTQRPQGGNIGSSMRCP